MKVMNNHIYVPIISQLHYLFCFVQSVGQERFGSMTRVYYKEAAGAFVVFDVTRSSTYEAVKIWKKDLDSKCFMADGSPVPAVLLGNKVK